MLFSLSLMVLVIGIEQFQKERKVTGWISIVAFLFVLFASLLVFLLN
ncbi:YczI family protein [Evansella cellulosilytica]|nr:YczI family protein [Evansella cellulosilytica]